MKKMLTTGGVALCSLLASPALAGFQMEGLKPFVVEYCDGAQKSTDEAMVSAPTGAWVNSSPDANTIGGPAWTAENCSAEPRERGGRYHKMKVPVAPHKHAPVPQK